MASADNKRWLQAWRDEHICDFHQLGINSVLVDSWSFDDFPKGQCVFVPLCGKSSDMLWLAEQGYDVIGVEISPIAVKDFFEENGLKPKRRQRGGFTQWSAGRIIIICGDFFKLTRAVLGAIDCIYDRASLTALSQLQRTQYVQKIKKLSAVPMLLLTIEERNKTDDAQKMNPIDLEIQNLYGEEYSIDLHMVREITIPDEDALFCQKSYIIKPR